MSSAFAEEISKMLHAREERWEKRQKMSQQCRTLVSVTLCIPKPMRCEKRWKDLLRNQCQRIREELLVRGFAPACAEELDGADGLALFLPCDGEVYAVKMCCACMEQDLPMGRVLDIDVMNHEGIQLSRTELGLPLRQCFLCGRPAVECASSRQHSPQEVAAWVEKLYVTQMPC